jgi:hypothetical protein
VIAPELILFVPDGYQKADHRLVLPIATSWLDALDAIHKIVGCDSPEVMKPPLTWRFQGKQKPKTLVLGTAALWADLQKEFTRDAIKNDPRIDVLIDESVSLLLHYDINY